MNIGRIVLAAVGAFAAYFALGGLLFCLLPAMRNEFQKYPAVYRAQEGQMSHMPAGMAAMFVAILALAVIYAMMYRSGYGVVDGVLFGALIGVFANRLVRGAQLCQPKHWTQADGAASRGVFRGVDGRGRRDSD